MKEKHPHYCQSFKPFVDRDSRVLILGSMPGPEALRRQQYYGFPGNHFWAIIPSLLGEPRPDDYAVKLDMLRRNRIALWDVIENCIRPGALDSDISEVAPNRIPELLESYPNIQAVFINGQLAHKLFHKAFPNDIKRPVFLLPSTSPANAAMPLKEKERRWGAILKFLYNGPVKKRSAKKGTKKS